MSSSLLYAVFKSCDSWLSKRNTVNALQPETGDYTPIVEYVRIIGENTPRGTTGNLIRKC